MSIALIQDRRFMKGNSRSPNLEVLFDYPVQQTCEKIAHCWFDAGPASQTFAHIHDAN